MTKTAISTNIIDRKAAARLLKTSLRTIDRYRHTGRLSTSIIDNKIYLDKAEIEAMIQKNSRQSRQSEKSYLSIDKRVDRRVDSGVDNGGDSDEDGEQEEGDNEDNEKDTKYNGPRKSHERPSESAIELYKKLYEELMEEMREKHAKLEGANYRVGQLEAQLKWSVPLVEHQQETKRLLLEGQQYKKISEEREMTVKKTKKDFLIERLNKRIYLAIVLVLVLLQPLWIFLAK